MDFLKKLFGGDKGDEKSGVQKQPSSTPIDRAQGSSEGQPVTKENHDQGHPAGGSGKNVCEFC